MDKKNQKSLLDYNVSAAGNEPVQNGARKDRPQAVSPIFRIDGIYISHPSIKARQMLAKEYQVAIAEEAIGQNTLVVLPTGTGKTEIAVMVYAELLYRNRCKMLFIASSKPLTVQAMERFKFWLKEPPEAALITGSTKQEDRAMLWSRSGMIFATPQTIEEDVKRGRYSLKDLSLLVVDEAHRAIGNHAYVSVISEYSSAVPSGRIIALTASTGAHLEKVMELKGNLRAEKIVYRNKESIDLANYVEEIESKVVTVTLPGEFKEIRSILRRIVDAILYKIKGAGFLEGFDSLNITKKAIQDCFRPEVEREIAAKKRYDILSMKYALMVVLDLINYVETESISSFISSVERILENEKKSRYARFLSMNEDLARALEIASRYRGIPHPKEDKLVEILNKFFADHSASTAIVFTSYRKMANELTELLASKNFTADMLIGQGVKSNETGMSQKKQTEVVERFKRGEFRVLVTTNIGEEGLDIPDTDLIVFYDSVSSEIRKIQRMGRTGRHRKGYVIFLLSEDTQDIGKFYNSIRKEKKMYQLLKVMDGQKRL